MSDAELERIRSAYRSRDVATETPYRWDNPAYVAYMQDLERTLLRALGDAGVSLAGACVLDVGCGGGYFLQRLHEYGAGDCHGIDLMEDRIAKGRELYPTLELHVEVRPSCRFQTAGSIWSHSSHASPRSSTTASVSTRRGRCGASPPAAGFSPGTCAACEAVAYNHRRAARAGAPAAVR